MNEMLSVIAAGQMSAWRARLFSEIREFIFPY